MKIKRAKKVVVAMSGGVDSSVAAVLLKEQGYDCIGIFLKFWKDPKNLVYQENTCCNQEALLSARAVAEKLKIPFYVLDVSREFKKEVVDYYISEYDNGRTPNPCVVCNKKIKFGWLLKKAKTLGAKYLATGHYARLRREFSISNLQFSNKSQIANIKLLKAKDKKKDQTYFLWRLTNNELKHILFPLGNYTKAEVRKLARKFNLLVAEKKESQDVCFVEKGKNNVFLTNYAKKLLKSGKIFSSEGKLLGGHKGLVFYTLGQRHGLEGIQLKKTTGGFQPAYVLKLEPDKNRIIVGTKKELYKNKLDVENVNLLEKWPKVFICRAKIRYGHPAENCQIACLAQLKRVKLSNGQGIKVIFDKPQRAITPGQSIVFYKGEQIIGGGVIK